MITNLNIIYMTALNFDTNTLRYYNNDNKQNIINEFQLIEKQLQEYFKKSKLCLLFK